DSSTAPTGRCGGSGARGRLRADRGSEADPWRRVSTLEADRRYVVHGGVFVVDRWRAVPRFLRASSRVRRRLRGAEGLVGYALIARFPDRTFIAVTAWTDQASLHRFVGTPVHSQAA